MGGQSWSSGSRGSCPPLPRAGPGSSRGKLRFESSPVHAMSRTITKEHLLHTISDGPPTISTVTHTDEPGIEARVLCTVDGFPAEIHHQVNTKRQEYNQHTLRVFCPVKMHWQDILRWGFVEAGHIPIHPDIETVARLSSLSTVMWSMANVVTLQARVRREDLAAGQFAAERMEFERQRDLYHETKNSVNEDFPAVDKGTLVPDADEAVVTEAVIVSEDQEAEASDEDR